MAADVVAVFPAMCAKLVVDIPYYRNAQGGADMFRILRAAKAEGFDVVSRQNVTEVIARIAQLWHVDHDPVWGDAIVASSLRRTMTSRTL